MSHWEAVGQSDEWYTPKYIFDSLGITFDLDVAAPASGPRHVPCLAFFYENSLSKQWVGTVWMNPPFGGRNALIPWLEKFCMHGDGIALVPDRTSAPWFQKYAPRMDCLMFVSPKVKFERPDGSIGVSPGSGTCLMSIGEKANKAMDKGRGLGMLLQTGLRGT